MNASSLEPGKNYFVEVAAINSAGKGPFAVTYPNFEKPRAPPSLAQSCKVYTMPALDHSLLVEWNGVKPYHGEDPSHYRIDFHTNGLLKKSSNVEEIDESSGCSLLVTTGLTPGEIYKVSIVSINSQGEGGPLWFNNVNLDDGSIVEQYQDYKSRYCHAVPTCRVSSDDCIEHNSYSILVRSRPLPPLFQLLVYRQRKGFLTIFFKYPFHPRAFPILGI